MSLPPERELTEFLKEHDFAALYRTYGWKEDNWREGFPNILRLEKEITVAAKNNFVKREHVLSVASWGSPRQRSRIGCPDTLRLPFFRADGAVEVDPLVPLTALDAATKQLGPALLSKVLRFAVPSHFGAVDTIIARVLSEQHNWLSLKVRNYGTGPYIARERPWPSGYAEWIRILRFLTHYLNDSGTRCPHPDDFITNGLRTQGVWLCADIEMALYSYAKKVRG